MKIFISSRIDELRRERKAAVDSVHFAGHEPVYIEAEPFAKDDKAKRAMDRMLSRSEALLSIAYMSLGHTSDILNDLTPIQYELRKFREMNPRGKIFMFEKACDIPRDFHLEDWLTRLKKSGIKIIEFNTAAKLSERIVGTLSGLPLHSEEATGPRRTIRYEGPDYIGLLEMLSETLFSRFGANINYISQGARSGLATVLLGCSLQGDGTPDSSLVEEELEETVAQDIEEQKLRQPKLMGNSGRHKVRIEVEEDESEPPDKEYSLEIRTIDTPGQLNAVCKVLKKLDFNIEDVTLRPAPLEYPRQTLISLWVSHVPLESSMGEHAEKLGVFARLESELHDIIGVRAYSVRMVSSTAARTESTPASQE